VAVDGYECQRPAARPLWHLIRGPPHAIAVPATITTGHTVLFVYEKGSMHDGLYARKNVIRQSKSTTLVLTKSLATWTHCPDSWREMQSVALQRAAAWSSWSLFSQRPLPAALARAPVSAVVHAQHVAPVRGQPHRRVLPALPSQAVEWNLRQLRRPMPVCTHVTHSPRLAMLFFSATVSANNPGMRMAMMTTEPESPTRSSPRVDMHDKDRAQGPGNLVSCALRQTCTQTAGPAEGAPVGVMRAQLAHIQPPEQLVAAVECQEAARAVRGRQGTARCPHPPAPPSSVSARRRACPTASAQPAALQRQEPWRPPALHEAPAATHATPGSAGLCALPHLPRRCGNAGHPHGGARERTACS